MNLHHGWLASLLVLLVIIVCVGVVAYLFNLFVPMSPKFKAAAGAILGLIMFLVILQVLFGIFPS